MSYWKVGNFARKRKVLRYSGWVIMPSHAHMIISSIKNDLEEIVRDMKSHTSTTLKKQIKTNAEESRRNWMIWMMERAGRKNGNNEEWQFWQQHNQPVQLFNLEMFYQKLTYIHENPVKAGFVEKAEEWLYSSARDFYGKKGLIDLSYVY